MDNRPHRKSIFEGQGAWWQRCDEEPALYAQRMYQRMLTLKAEGHGCYYIERATSIGYRTVDRWLRNGLPQWLTRRAAKVQQQIEAELRGEVEI